MSNMIYLPFNSSNSEKLKIKDIQNIYDSKDLVNIILYRLEKELDNGDIVEYYKATKFFRLVRTSKEAKANNKLLNIHSDIIRGMYQSNINFCQIIANILQTDKENALGLLFFYGVQAISSTKEDAIRECEKDFSALLGSFQATHRTAHIQNPTQLEILWLFKKLREQNHIIVVKGIPQPKLSASNSKNISKIEISSDEQMEQFLSGLVTEEFMLLLMATPIEQSVLRNWLTKSLKEQTKWESQKQGSNSLSAGISVPMSISLGSGTSQGVSSNKGTSQGSSLGSSWGTNESTSNSKSIGVSNGISKNISEGTSESKNFGTSQGYSTNYTESESRGTSSSDTMGGSVNTSAVVFGGSANYSHSNSSNQSISNSNSIGQNTGISEGQSSGTNRSTSVGENESFNASESNSVSRGVSEGKSSSSNFGFNESEGKNVGTNSSFGKSMGLAPSMSIGKTYQFIDVTVAYICELLNTQNQRLKNSTEGEGAFFVDMYLSCNNEIIQKTIQSLITTTWVNPDSKIDVIRGLIPDRKEQKKLSLHMMALSPCLEMEINNVGKFYKYASILQSSEISAYSHPPRISIGGIDNSMEDRPKLSVPVDRQNKEIFLGYIINGEIFNINQANNNRGNGYLTAFKYSVGTNELHHAFISGQAGSGKTVLATRFITGLYLDTFTIDRITKEKKKKRILVLDPKGEWRMLGNIIPKGKFRFWSLSDPHFHPLRLNLLRVPRYVRASDYYNMVVEMFCSAYGLMDRAVAQIGSVIYDLYEKKGAFDNDFDPHYANERTKDITFEDVYDSLLGHREIAINKRDNHNAEALQTYLTRLDAFKKAKSKEFIMFCNRGGKSVDEVLGGDEVTIIESSGLAKAPQAFFFTLTMTSIFKYAQGVKGFYRPNQFETFIVLEEANTVLISGGKDDETSNMGIKRIEEVIDQSRSFGLFLWILTQKIASMPDSVIANSGIVCAGKSTREEDVKIVMKAIGRDPRYDDRPLEKFFPRMPVGEFVIKISKGEKEIDQEPVMVKVAPLEVEIPSDDELEIIINENRMAREMNK